MQHFRLCQFPCALGFQETLIFCVLLILIQVLSQIPHFLFKSHACLVLWVTIPKKMILLSNSSLAYKHLKEVKDSIGQ